MEKVRIIDLVKFRRKTERSKKTFANNLKSWQKQKNDKSSGDYWISCLSTISNVFKFNNKALLKEKIDLLSSKIEATNDKRVKNRFQRNLDIVASFEDFDFEELKPEAELKFQNKPRKESILDIKDFPLQAKPDHVFTFSINGSDEIGAIWFIAQIGGFDKVELGMFADIIYRYLEKNYSKDYFVNSTYCTAVDVFKGQKVCYKDIENGKIPVVIEQTIDEIKRI